MARHLRDEHEINTNPQVFRRLKKRFPDLPEKQKEFFEKLECTEHQFLASDALKMAQHLQKVHNGCFGEAMMKLLPRRYPIQEPLERIYKNLAEFNILTDNENVVFEAETANIEIYG